MAWKGSTRAETLPPSWRTIRARILRRDQHACQIRYPGICLLKASQVDHIGDRLDHNDANLQAACAPCNQRKNIATRPKPASRKRPAERHPGLLG